MDSRRKNSRYRSGFYPGARAVLLASCLALLLGACSDSELNIHDPRRVGIGAPESLLEIYAPESGSVLEANMPFILDYAVVRGDKGNHITIRIDEQRPFKVAQIQARHHMEGLPPGPHTITVTEYTKDDLPTGGQATIHIIMQ